MALYVVVRRNKYFRPGTFLELFEDGFQKVRFKTEGHRLHILGHEGIVLPESELRPFVMKVLKRGLDK